MNIIQTSCKCLLYFHAMITYTNQNPLFCRVPNMEPYIGSIVNLQNNGFWLVKECKIIKFLRKHGHACCILKSS